MEKLECTASNKQKVSGELILDSGYGCAEDDLSWKVDIKKLCMKKLNQASYKERERKRR